MISDLLSVYNSGNSYLVLNPKVPAWIVTNLTGVFALKLYADNNSAEIIADTLASKNPEIKKEAIISFLALADDNHLFSEEENHQYHKAYSLNNVYLNMTQICNLRCIYCYAASRKERGENNLTYEEYINLLNDLKAISPNLRISFTGGEPLMSENTIKVAKYAKSIGFKTTLMTNATLIGDNNIDDICNAFDAFQISIDGSDADKHNHYRGEGNYQKSSHAIELLKSNKVNVRIAMTVTKENEDDVKAMSERWGKDLIFQPLFPLGRAENDQNVLSGKEYYATLSKNPRVNPFNRINSIVKTSYNHRIDKCALGDGEISISCTGDVYPCQLLHNERFLLGNIRDNSIADIYNSEKNNFFKYHTVEKIQKCCTCDFRYLCGGACQARHFAETGSIDKAGDFCEYEQEGIINGLIKSCQMIEL